MSLTGFEVEIQREVDGGLSTEDMTLSMGPQHPSRTACSASSCAPTAR